MHERSGSSGSVDGFNGPKRGLAAAPRTWAVEQVAERVNEAAATLKRLPGERRLGYRTSLPAPARDDRDAWLQAGFDGDPLGLYKKQIPLARQGAPTGAAIDRMFEVLTWMCWNGDRRVRKVMWGRALGIPWRVLEGRLGRRRQTLDRWCKAGLESISRNLKAVEENRRTTS
ncbi:MAG: DUF6362 family protein [Rhodospirillales bacterium]|jgi:hypothetical protein|nr:DUF6362 family protein [Rhodospirillales bacterium]